jgi:predicted component of type VI protein secretion system
MPKLYVLTGPDLGRSFEVADGARLGRAVHCEVHLRDVSVSREHARLVHADDRWRVVDTGSRNGVSVGGARVEGADLTDGAEFLVGEVLLRFRADAPVPAASNPAAHVPKTAAPPPARNAPDYQEIVLEEDPLAAVAIPERTSAPARVASELERTLVSAPRPGVAVPRSRGILQYKRVADRPGFFASDLGQHALWVRLGVGVLALAVFAGLFYAAFRGTALLKAQAAGSTGSSELESDR